MRPGMRKLFTRHGYQYWGRNAKDEDAWAVEFDKPDNPTAGYNLPVAESLPAEEVVPATTTTRPISFRLSTAKITKTKERNANEDNRSSESMERRRLSRDAHP